MRVLMAPDQVGALSPAAAAAVLTEGWQERAASVDVVSCPQSSGGAGLLSAVGAATGAQLVPGDDDPRRAVVRLDGTVYVEAAALVEPGSTSSHAVGRRLRELLDAGERSVVVGLGDGPGLDGGLGALQALAGRPDEPDTREPVDDLAWLPAVREQLRDVSLTCAVASDRALLGFQGAAMAGVETHGHTREQAQEREQRMGWLVDRVRRVLPPGTDLLTGYHRRPEREAGAGAGGGLGYGLSVVGARLEPGPDLVAQVTGLDDAVTQAAIVVTATEVYDWRVLQHSVLERVSRSARRDGTPALVLAVEQQVGRRETMSSGYQGAYSVVPAGRLVRDVATQDVATDLRALAHRVAGTWTPER